MGNKGAFVRFLGKDMEPKIVSFEKVDHPKIPPMAYASGFGGLFWFYILLIISIYFIIIFYDYILIFYYLGFLGFGVFGVLGF